MPKTKCAFGNRGKSTIEFYKCDVPQRYCYGCISEYTGQPPDECKNCPDHIDNAQKDFEEWQANGNCMGVQ